MKGNAFVHLIKYRIGLEKPHSQTTKEEREVLKKYSADLKSAVEIGVYEGVNTVLIAKSLSAEGVLYGIDPFFKGKLGISYPEVITKQELQKNGLLARVKLLPMFSYEAVDLVPDEIDFIFIDGDHSYEGIKKDWADWSKKIKPGGIIALHDTSIPSHNKTIAELGSYKYFNEIIKNDIQFIIKETVDSLNVLQKVVNV